MTGVSNSEYYMWRTLFALAHADHVVTDEEVRFMAEAMEDVPFNKEQHDQLLKDTKDPQDIEAMFSNISESRDQARFFKFAHELVHIDGDYGKEEQAIMLKLKEMHVRLTDVDDLVGDVGLEFEDDQSMRARIEGVPPFKQRLLSFRNRFLKDLIG